MTDRLKSRTVLSLADAAPLLGVSRTTAWDLAIKGEFPGAFKVGSRWKVSVPRFNHAVHGTPIPTAGELSLQIDGATRAALLRKGRNTFRLGLSSTEPPKDEDEK